MSKIAVKALDPETDRLIWALAARISKLPATEQAYSTIVAVTALLSEQTEETIRKVFDGARELVTDYQASPGFKNTRPS